MPYSDYNHLQSNTIIEVDRGAHYNVHQNGLFMFTARRDNARRHGVLRRHRVWHSVLHTAHGVSRALASQPLQIPSVCATDESLWALAA